MNNQCDIVQDLIPLVQDDAASAESREFVETHIAECEVCLAVFEAARKEDSPVSTDDRKNLRQIKKKLYIGFACIFLVCLGVCSFLPFDNSSGAFFYNLYFMPLLGAAGAVIFRRRWYITPVLVYVFSGAAFWIREGDLWISLQMGLLCAIASLSGCLIAVLLRFAIKGRRWK